MKDLVQGTAAIAMFAFGSGLLLFGLFGSMARGQVQWATIGFGSAGLSASAFVWVAAEVIGREP